MIWRHHSLTILSLALVHSAVATAAVHPIAFEDLARIQRVSDPQLSLDGKWIAYVLTTANLEANQLESNLWMVAASGSAPRQLTRTGKDRSPRWSPDGTSIAFLSTRNGSSQVHLLTFQSGEPRQLTNVPSGVDILKWSPDGHAIAFTSSAQSDCRPGPCAPDSKVARVYEHWPYWNWTRWLDGKHSHLFVIPIDGQGAPTDLGNSWSYRWNPEVFASPGYVVLMINRRGSTGYGQQFTDSVVTDWGGKAYEDIMSGVDAAVRAYPFIDGTRVAAAGASYGGYMADWLATHTGRFKTIVSHAGVYDLTSMYASDIPWFQEFEMHATPWEISQNYKQWSPSEFAGALGKFKTPVLVTAGEKDYRVPVTQSLELFSALQRQGVPSKLVIFPDEGHWILKPKDSQLWNQVVLDWLGLYLK